MRLDGRCLLPSNNGHSCAAPVFAVCRLQSKEALCCPLRVCSALIDQCEISPIATVIECLEHAPPLVIDVMSYTIVAKMADGSPRLKSDGVTVADWLQVCVCLYPCTHYRYGVVVLSVLSCSSQSFPGGLCFTQPGPPLVVHCCCSLLSCCAVNTGNGQILRSALPPSP